MLNSLEVRVRTTKSIPKHNEGGDESDNKNFSTNVLVDSRGYDRESVSDKPIWGTVFHPVVVTVYGSSVLSTFLSIGNTLRERDGGRRLGCTMQLGVNRNTRRSKKKSI